MINYKLHGEAVAQGLVDGCIQYARWSRDANILAWGVEPYLSSKVAERLYKASKGRGWVTLETPISDLHEWSGANLSGRPSGLINKKGRVDVAFYNRDEELRGLIEIKRHFGFSGSRADVERLVAMLKRYGKDHGGSLRWACIAAVHLTSEASRKKASARLEGVLGKLKHVYPDVTFDGFIKAAAAPPEAHRYPNCPTEIVGVSVLFRI